MIGFSIEFKRWYITLRGPSGRVYLCTGFAKTDEELLNQLKSIR